MTERRSPLGVRALDRRDLLRAAAAAPAAGLAASGCSQSDPPLGGGADDGGGSPDDFDVRELQDMLDRRAEALLAGDEESYLADLDQSNSELLERERLVFANLQQFDTDDVQFVTAQASGSLDPAQLDQESPPYTYVPVTKVVKLTADSGPDGVLGPGHSFEYVVDRRDGAWTVIDIVPIDLAELQEWAGSATAQTAVVPAHAPWLQDRLQVVNVGNVWLVGDDSVPDLDKFASEVEAEVQHVEAVWGDRPRFPGHVLFLTRDEEAYGRWFSLGRHMDEIGTRDGFAVPVPGIRSNGEIYRGEFAGARNMIFLPVSESRGWEAALTMRHELTHTTTMRAFGTGDSGLSTSPAAWAVEGFANYVMVRGDSTLEQGMINNAMQGFDGVLPGSDTFQTGDPETVTRNYSVSYTVFRFIEQLRDFETSIDFYAETIKYDDGLLWGTYTPFIEMPAFNGLCERVLGMGSSEFLDQWASFVRAGA